MGDAVTVAVAAVVVRGKTVPCFRPVVAGDVCEKMRCLAGATPCCSHAVSLKSA